jgi:predicted nucleic acid-binding Zn ribbon protein
VADQKGQDEQVKLARDALAAAKAGARARGARPMPEPRRPAPDGSAGATGANTGGAPGPDAGTAGQDGASARPSRRGPRRSGSRPGFAPQPQRDDPLALSAAIGGLLDAEGWALAAATGSVFGRWAEIVGPELAAHTKPESLADGELIVSADSTAWATQVRLLAAQLVRRLNTELGHGSVLRVKVRGPVTSVRKRGEWRVRGSRGPRDTYG